MTTYKEVFKLAQSKGFKRSIVTYFKGINGLYNKGDVPIVNLLELTLMQKYLRDEHKIIVVVNTFDVGFLEKGKWCYQYSIKNKTDKDSDCFISANEYKIWEKALLEGVFGGLKLIS